MEPPRNEPPDEPPNLCCPITQVIFRDPVFVPEAGTTYERGAILTFWRQAGERRDPLTNTPIRSDVLYTNWDKRREVASWLGEHLDYTPQGWRSRDDIPQGRRIIFDPPQSDRNPQQLLAAARRFPGLSSKTCAILACIITAISSGLGVNISAELVSIAVGSAQPPSDDSCNASPYGKISGREPTAHGIIAARILWIDDAGRQKPFFFGARPSTSTPGLSSRLQISVLQTPSAEASDSARGGSLITEAHTNTGDGAVWSRSAGRYVTVSAPGVTFSTMVEQYKTLAAAHGLRLDMPHGSLFSGDNFASLVVLGFTTLWTGSALRADAPLLFTLFSCPFWHVGASLLANTLRALLHRSTLALHEGGIQVENERSALAEYFLADFDLFHSPTCAFVPWSELVSAGSLEESLHLTVTHVINGVESGLLEVRTVRGTLALTGGADLTMNELRKVRELLLLWAREKGLGIQSVEARQEA